MNGKSHESETDGDHETSNFDRQLDRLVDGELSGLEYREFVKSFDQRPDGWRRCGVAFLEAQAWRQDFLAVRTSESLEPRSSDERRGEERRAD